jgi:hypothetical protein
MLCAIKEIRGTDKKLQPISVQVHKINGKRVTRRLSSQVANNRDGYINLRQGWIISFFLHLQAPYHMYMMSMTNICIVNDSCM